MGPTCKLVRRERNENVVPSKHAYDGEGTAEKSQVFVGKRWSRVHRKKVGGMTEETRMIL